MMSLQQVYDKVKGLSDKGTVHSYISFYDELLTPYAGKGATVLELGTYKGGSLLMWEEFLINATVHGVDRTLPPTSLANRAAIRYHRLDLNRLTPELVSREFGTELFDVIIEDADHSVTQQLRCLELFMPLLKVGGTYVIEDVASDTNRNTILAKAGTTASVHDFRSIRKRFDDVIISIHKE